MNEYHAGEWTLLWLGYERPANQVVKIGVWMAFRDGDDGMWCATTLGHCGYYRHHFDTIDTSLQKGWPEHSERLSDHALTDLRHRTFTLLIDTLKTQP